MTAKFSASADGTKVYVGNTSENALEINATGKTIKAVAPYAIQGQSAANTPFTPSGNIAANNVQSAIAELDSEKAPLNKGVFASVVFVGNGPNGPCAVGASQGVANVTKTGTGAYDVYFSAAQPNNEYVIIAVCDANGPAFLALPFINNSDTTKAGILTYNNAGVLTDATRVHVMINRP